MVYYVFDYHTVWLFDEDWRKTLHLSFFATEFHLCRLPWQEHMYKIIKHNLFKCFYIKIGRNIFFAKLADSLVLVDEAKIVIIALPIEQKALLAKERMCLQINSNQWNAFKKDKRRVIIVQIQTWEKWDGEEITLQHWGYWWIKGQDWCFGAEGTSDSETGLRY